MPATCALPPSCGRCRFWVYPYRWYGPSATPFRRPDDLRGRGRQRLAQVEETRAPPVATDGADPPASPQRVGVMVRAEPTATGHEGEPTDTSLWTDRGIGCGIPGGRPRGCPQPGPDTVAPCESSTPATGPRSTQSRLTSTTTARLPRVVRGWSSTWWPPWTVPRRWPVGRAALAEPATATSFRRSVDCPTWSWSVQEPYELRATDRLKTPPIRWLPDAPPRDGPRGPAWWWCPAPWTLTPPSPCLPRTIPVIRHPWWPPSRVLPPTAGLPWSRWPSWWCAARRWWT